MTSEPGQEARHAIESVALDYYEGWFDGDAIRMERALHPQLVKRSLSKDERAVDTISAREMVEDTVAGAGLARDPGQSERNIVIQVDHVYEDIATATVTSAVYVDYLQLARTREGWKIVNVLWDRVARPDA